MLKYTAIVMAMIFCSLNVQADDFMGDYQGSMITDATKEVAAQIIARDKGTYEARIINNFKESGKQFLMLTGKKVGDMVVFSGSFVLNSFDARFNGDDVELSIWAGKIKDGVFSCRKYSVKGGEKLAGTTVSSFKMKKTVRLSPTLNAKPPAGAIILLGKDTKDLSAWENIRGRGKRFPAEWKLKDGVMEVTRRMGNIVTKQEFASYQMHLEFRLPLMANAKGQGRANSGVYNFGRYETQVLDSYGLEGRDNECGGIYKAGPPKINMCAPPLQWQTYDITFTAPAFENDKKVKNAFITVVHNGVVVQDNTELKGCTPGGVSKKEAPKGPLFLQDHGNPVQFRNIWIVEKK